MTVRTNFLKIRASESELSAWREKAKAAELSLSELLRQSLDQATVANRNDHQRLIIALTRLGVNLNQIAAWVNRSGDSLDALTVIPYLIDLERQVAALVEAQGERP